MIQWFLRSVARTKPANTDTNRWEFIRIPCGLVQVFSKISSAILRTQMNR